MKTKTCKRRRVRINADGSYNKHDLKHNKKCSRKSKNTKGRLKKKKYCQAKLIFGTRSHMGSLLRNNIVCYELSDNEKHILQKKLHSQIPHSCLKTKACRKCVKPTYIDIINALIKIEDGKIVTIFGGAVRDYIFSGYTSLSALKDIDVNFRTTMRNITQIFDNEPFNCFKYQINDNKRYLRVGDINKSNEYFEGFHITNRSYEYQQLESRCNSLSIMIKGDEYTLIDFFKGKGIKDAIRKVYCAPFPDEYLENDTLMNSWANNKNLLWRMFKFLAKGYTIEHNTAITLYRYWWSNRNAQRSLPLVELRWNDIWKIINPKDIDKLFGYSGIMKKELLQFKGIYGVPSYSEMIDCMVSKKLMNYYLIPNIPNPIIESEKSY